MSSDDGWETRIGWDGELIVESEPLEYAEKGIPVAYPEVHLNFHALTIKRGDIRINLPFLGDSDVVFDVEDLMDFGEEWTAGRLRRFAEWFGYTIEPNPDSVLGFRVTSPSGKALGGTVARQIITAWQANPNPAAGGGPGKKGKGKKGGGGAKAPAVDKAQKAADALAKAQSSAIDAIDKIDPETLETRSKGKVSAQTVADFVKRAQERLKSAPDAKAVRDIIREMKSEISKYKTEMTKPPRWDVQLANTKSKLKENLPSAMRLAGTSYDESAIQGIINKHMRDIDAAGDEAGARAAVKALRNAVADYKLEQQKQKKAQKELDALNKEAQKELTALKANGGPRTASEWADYYAEQMLGNG